MPVCTRSISCPDFISKLNDCQKQRVEVVSSQRIYKFGGGEIRPSKCVVKLPCYLAGKDLAIRTEVVEADIPLLIGNSTLKRAKAVLHIEKGKVELLGNLIEMKEMDSGHFEIDIYLPKQKSEAVKMNKVMVDRVSALHSVREVFIQCESDRVLRTALKKRVYGSLK